MKEKSKIKNPRHKVSATQHRRTSRRVRLRRKISKARIDAKGMSYRELNERIRRALDKGADSIILNNVNGQRYLGDGIRGNAKIVVNGTPGNDLAAFMDGPTVIVNGNGQDGIGNTMNSGKIIIHGDTGDTLGYAMRGGKIYLEGDAGYRVGIHMKSYRDLCPVIIIGGCAGDFLGEYMAGGLIIVLGQNRHRGESVVGGFCGTGMHGGKMYIHGAVEDYKLGREIKAFRMDREDREILEGYLREYGSYFSLDVEKTLNSEFVKLFPLSSRPYGKLYAY